MHCSKGRAGSSPAPGTYSRSPLTQHDQSRSVRIEDASVRAEQLHLRKPRDAQPLGQRLRVDQLDRELELAHATVADQEALRATSPVVVVDRDPVDHQVY